MSGGMDAHVAALMMTPTRRRRVQRWESDESTAAGKAPRPRASSKPACRRPSSPEPLEKSHLASTVPVKLANVDSDIANSKPEKPRSVENSTNCDGDSELIPKLFDAMESALILLSGRRTRASLPVVRQAVELDLGRDLDDTRLRRILTAAEGMIEISWHGKGSAAVLELIQRADNGDARPPTTAERSARRARFLTALHAVTEAKPLPQRPEGFEPNTPARPSASPCPFASPFPSPAPSASPFASPVASPCMSKLSLASRFAEVDNSVDCTSFMKPRKLIDESSSGNSRLQSLRERIQKREIADRAAEKHKQMISELLRRIATCEEAMIAHGVVVHLFARGGSFTDEYFASSQIDALFQQGGGSSGKASEAEVINGLTAARSGMQSRRPIDVNSAREALDCLTEFAAGWFDRSPLQFSNRPGSILRKLPGGSSTSCTKALSSELTRLNDERVSLENAGITVGENGNTVAVQVPVPSAVVRAASPVKTSSTSDLLASTPARRRARAESQDVVVATPCRKSRRDATPRGQPTPAASPTTAPVSLPPCAVAATPRRRLRRVVTYEDETFMPSSSPSAACVPSPRVEATPRRRLHRVTSCADSDVPALQHVAATPQKRTRSNGPNSTDTATVAEFATPSKRLTRLESKTTTTPAIGKNSACQNAASGATPSIQGSFQQNKKDSAKFGFRDQGFSKLSTTGATPSKRIARSENGVCQPSPFPPSATPRRRVRGKTPSAELGLC